MGMGKQAAVILGSILAVALSVVVGKEMSTEAMAVVIGVVCGVAAGIPTVPLSHREASVLLLVVLTRSPKSRTPVRSRSATTLGGTSPGCRPVLWPGTGDGGEARDRRAMAEAQRGGPPVVVIQRDSMETGYWLVQAPGGTDGRFYVVERDDLLRDACGERSRTGG